MTDNIDNRDMDDQFRNAALNYRISNYMYFT